MQKLPFIFLAVGLFFLIAAIVVGWVVFPKSVEKKISQNVRLEEGSLTFSKWQNITTPIYIRYNIFNVTNPHDIVTGSKPVLDEKGPYVYEQKRVKRIISVDEENDTVTYGQTVTYFFREDLSIGSEEDIFTIINIPLISFSAAPLALRGILDNFISKNQEQVFIQRSVSELLFKGYLQHSVKDLSANLQKEIMPNNTFGLYYGKNGTEGVPFKVHRGVRDSGEFGQIVQWDNKSELTWWGGKFCNQLNGTDGSIFAPFVTRDRTLRIFSEELCRSLYLTYSGDVEYMGIPGFRFALPRKLLARADDNEDNRCFCENIGSEVAAPAEATNVVTLDEDDFGGDFFGDDEEDEEVKKQQEEEARIEKEKEEERKRKQCRAGVILLSACRQGKPIAASTPHFLFGEEEDVNNAIGIFPVEEKHETYIDLEPNTGLVLQASKKIQVNVQLKPQRGLKKWGLDQVPEMLFPILWADEYAGMPAEKAEEFKDKLLSTLHIADISRWAVLVVSAILVIAAIAIFILRARKSKNIPKY